MLKGLTAPWLGDFCRTYGPFHGILPRLFVEMMSIGCAASWLARSSARGQDKRPAPRPSDPGVHSFKRKRPIDLANAIRDGRLGQTIICSGSDKSAVAHCVKRLNVGFLCLTTTGVITLIVFDAVAPLVMGGASRRFAVGVFAAYALWRCNEVFLAFISDATADLRPTAHATNLKYYERIRLAIRSYIELILAYGLVFRAASEFFGGVTITTIGYGDIHPTHWLPGFFTIYEFLNGVVLIVVSFTVYVSRSIAASEFSSHNADSDRPGR